MKFKKEDLSAYSIYAVIIILVAVMALSGCATFNKVVTNNALVSQLAVEAAAARVLYEHPQWRDKTVTITAASVSAIDAKTTVDLASMEAFIRSHITWSKLLPEEQAILSVLITQSRANLEDSFRAQNVVDPGRQMVAVRQVLEWINQTAKRQ